MKALIDPKGHLHLERGGNMRPMDCRFTVHWTNNPDIARVLYQWGADFSLMDINRKYPEETYGGPYYNHLVDYIGQGCFVIGYRTKKDFVDVAYEILYLAGERKPPDGWMLPSKMVQSVD